MNDYIDPDPELPKNARFLQSITIHPEKTTKGKVRPANPADIGYPSTLPVEIALNIGSTTEICKAYGISRKQWDLIRHDPVFIEDLKRAQNMLAKEGVSFKVKAGMQAEALLSNTWKMIHDPEIPAPVRADLIKSVVRWAGFEAQAQASAAQAGTGFSISINFSDRDSGGRVINQD